MTGGVVRINTHCTPWAAGGVGISDHHRGDRYRLRGRHQRGGWGDHPWRLGGVLRSWTHYPSQDVFNLERW